MHIKLIAVGDKPPDWVRAGYGEYAGRLPRPWRMGVTEISPAKRHKNSNTDRLRKQEAERILSALPEGTHGVALALDGSHWDTKRLARELALWLQAGRNLALVVGGPDGLDASVRARCETSWALSKLTFPHALVRVLVVEQLYRAWSLLNNHPYHRA